jgi:predicted permease
MLRFRWRPHRSQCEIRSAGMSSTLSLRQAWIRVARNKAMFGLIAVALGSTLGAVICALTFTHLVTARPLPYPQQERLVVAEQVIADHGDNAHSRAFSYPAIALLHREAQGAFALAVMMDHARDVVVSHPAQPLANVNYTTGDYAEIFAPPMALGRFPAAGEGWDGTRPVAVISHAAWQTLFNKREDVLGKHVRTASGMDFEVVGVTSRAFVEPEFHGPGHRTALWLPWGYNPSPRQWGWSATTDTLSLVGRLAPEVTMHQVAERLSERMNARWRDGLGASSSSYAGWSTRVELTGAQRAIAGDSVDVGPLLLAGTLGLILLTLANVTHLLVARVAERTRDFSIQLALGASTKHLFAQVLADMLLLMLPAALVAVAVAAAGFALMRHYLGTMLSRLEELSLGWNTVALSIGATVALAVLIAGIALASGERPAANGALNAGRRATATTLSRRLRAVLMASQVGVAGLLIAVSAGLFRDADRILNERGIDLERTMSAFLYPSTSAVKVDMSLEQQFGQVRRRLANLPGVEKISQSHSPLQDFIRTAVVSARNAAQHPVELKRVDQEYLGITGHSLALGRNFNASEIEREAEVALVNTAFAKVLERDGGVLGASLSRGGGSPYTVVGVVDDLAYPGTATNSPRIYLPASAAGSNFIIRFRPGEHMSREQLVAFIAGVNPRLGVFLYDDLDRQRSDILLPRRITATATLVVAFIVVLVSAMGLYGMVRYATRLIRTEIGTRRAFGARSRDIVLMLVKGNLAAVICGSIASAAIALLVLPRANPWFGELAFDLHWGDVAAALGALGLLAILACYLSARPLLRQSPAAALREADR